MASFNKVILVGNLTRDPELRYTPKGMAIAKIGLAVNRAWKSETGEPREETTFLDIEAWGRTAEIVGQYLHKGSPALFEGRLRLDTWEDKQTGQKRSKLVVVAEGMQLLGSRSSGEPATAPPSGVAPAPAPSPQPAAPPPAPAAPEQAAPDEEDVPF